MPLTGPESVYKAYGLMHQLDRFQGGSRLFVVAFGKAQQRLASSGASRLQIVAQRRRIRTLAVSELPDQDCCTLLTPRHVETRARIDDLRRIEARLEAADLAEELAGLAQEYRPERP